MPDQQTAWAGLRGAFGGEFRALTAGQRWTAGLFGAAAAAFLLFGLPGARVIETDEIVGSLAAPPSAVGPAASPTNDVGGPALPPVASPEVPTTLNTNGVRHFPVPAPLAAPSPAPSTPAAAPSPAPTPAPSGPPPAGDPVAEALAALAQACSQVPLELPVLDICAMFQPIGVPAFWTR
jgi:hypothetical protein